VKTKNVSPVNSNHPADSGSEGMVQSTSSVAASSVNQQDNIEMCSCSQHEKVQHLKREVTEVNEEIRTT